MRELEWYGCYADKWGDEITPDAFTHPAKFARGLIRRIYRHMIERGYVKPGDKIADPFGGVGLGALDAMKHGLHWRALELEEKFVTLGNGNLALWRERYANVMPGWGTAVLMQGDSRQLAQVLGGADGVVSSPPYAVHQMGGGGEKHDKVIDAMKTGYGRSPGQLGAMPEGDYDAAVSSPPFGAGETRNRSPYQDGYVADMMSRAYTQDKQGTTDGNLATLKADDEGFSAALTSPPYAETIGTGEGPGARHDPVHHKGDNAHKNSSSPEYGRSDGQLGAMRDDGYEAAVTRPPFETGLAAHNTKDGYFDRIGGVRHERLSYGNHPANIGNQNGDTFWTAARAIMEQLHIILKPGGYAVFVCGDFVRNKRRVYFGRQWMALCQAVGFEPVEWITAWKREPGPVQTASIGDDLDHTIDRVSFFRRLSNAKGAARLLWATLDQSVKDYYIAAMSLELWREYREIEAGMDKPEPPQTLTIEALAEYESSMKQYEAIAQRQKNNKPPTPAKIEADAQIAAWIDNERPAAPVAILNEDVIIMRKKEVMPIK